MTDIPDDVMAKAREIVSWHLEPPAELMVLDIAHAIMAERERCAKVAEADGGLVPNGFGKMDFGPNTARRIAAAIRKGQP